MTKKRKRITGLLVLTTLAAAFFLFVPKYYFKDDEKTIELHRIVHVDAGEETDITEYIAVENLRNYWYILKCSRYRTPFAPYPMSKVEYCIDGTYGGEPFHILLGDSGLNVVYESAEQGGYRIKNSDIWLNTMKRFGKDIAE